MNKPAAMQYIDEFRDGQLARGLARAIAAAVDPARDYRLMEFCGGHTHAIFRYGVQDLTPANLRFVHGPGCPVCVLPMARIDQAIAMAIEHEVVLCTYGDLMRVPASARNSLLKAKAGGADIRMIYSTMDALAIARADAERQVVLFAIGFETTTPPTAVALKVARAERLSNFSVFCNHLLTPPALANILASAAPGADAQGVQIDGVLGPSHVSTIIGSRAYEFVPLEYAKPLVIAGFEPLDVMQSVAAGAADQPAALSRRKSIQARREPRWQPQGAGADGRDLQRSRSIRMARTGTASPQRVAHRRRLCRVRCRGALFGHAGSCQGDQGLRMPQRTARQHRAAGVQIVRHCLHAGKPHGRLHGVLGRRLCRLLELRALSPIRNGADKRIVGDCRSSA